MSISKLFISFVLLTLTTLFPLAANAKQNKQQIGVASWYGPGFHGKLMANGQRFNQWGNSVAHRTLPLGTKVLITNVNTGESVRATIRDRGPFHGNRVLDVSKGIAYKLGFVDKGLCKVKIQVLSTPKKAETYHTPKSKHASYAPDKIESLIERIDIEQTRLAFQTRNTNRF